jgi:hypothetical protein
MTVRDIGFFAACAGICAAVGVMVGIVCRGRLPFAIFGSLAASIALFVATEMRFGSPEEWSWQFPIVSAAYLLGPYLIVFAAPAVVASVAASRWMLRRKVI